MPTYIIEGKKVKSEAPLSEADIDEIAASIKGSVAEKPVEKSKEAPKDVYGKTTTPFLKGVLDVPVGVAQLFMEGATGLSSGFGLMPNKVSDKLAAETAAMNERIKAGEKLYEETRKQGLGENESPGFDWGRLGGNVGGSILTGGATAGAAKAPWLVRSASAGAASAATQPVVTDDFWAAKTGQVVTGAVLGPLTEGGIKGVGALIKIGQGLTPKGREEALRKMLNELAGEDKAKVISALQDATELVKGSRPTAAEALSNIPSAAELVAAQAKLSSKTGVAGKFATREAEQQAARVRALNEIAGTEAQRAAVAAKRSSVTGAQRETALEAADTAANTVTGVESAIKNDYAKLHSSIWQDTQQAANQRNAATMRRLQQSQAQLNALEQSGVFPLRVDDVVGQIDSALKGTTSDLSKDVLNNVKKVLISKADENGILSSRDVYENVRKSLNTDVASFLTQGEKYAAGGVPQQAAKTASNVKGFIDAALDKSSDGVWSKYLKNYQAYSEKLNRMEVGDFLSKQLQTNLDKERAGVFANAVQNAASTIKKSTGIPRYDKLSDVLTPKETASVNAVLADLNRKVKAEQLGSKVGNLPEGVPNPAAEIPNLLSRTIAISKAVVEHLQRGNTAEFNKNMAELMLNPQQMATFMTTAVPKGRVQEFTAAMMKKMDEPTRQAFIQAFTVPAASGMIGGTLGK